MNERLSLPFDTGAIDVADGATVLALRANPCALYNQFGDRLTCVQGMKPVAQRLSAHGLTVVQDIPQDTTPQIVIVELTRSKAESLALVAQGYAAVAMNGVLVIDGMKTDGIESVLKIVKQRHAVQPPLSKAHGKVFWLTKTENTNPFADWAGASVATPNADGFLTAAGMFSPDASDAGSGLLAETIGTLLKGKGADLGSGWGWLSHQVLARNLAVTALTGYEAEHSALVCAQQNVVDPRADFLWANVIGMTAAADHDFVVMNPPFHQSRKADPELGRQFIQTAAQMLQPKGTLWMVANKQLAYEATLNACFTKWDYVVQTPRFKVVKASRPKRQR